MPEEIVMPRLSDTMEEGTIARWLKKVGETVHKGEAILEVETDKANMELQAYHDGVIQQIIQSDGATVPIGTVVGLLTKPGEAFTPPQATPAETPAAAANGASSTAAGAVAAQTAAPTTRHNGAVGAAEVAEARIKATPLARNIARQQGIDLVALAGQGSGPGGRIVADDIERYLAQGGAVSRVAPAMPAPEPAPLEAPLPEPVAAGAPAGGIELRKPNRIQQVMARRLTESKTTIPHFYVTNEVDMAAAAALRKQLLDTFGPDSKVSYNDLIVRACALALRAMPQVNASWRDGQFAYYNYVNIGIAVDIPDGLVVPVVRDADRKGLRELASETRALAEKARAGKLTPREMEGGTFTVSNLGSVVKDLEEFQAVINPPESAILAVGGIIDKPVALDGQVVIRPRMRLTLSVDHRVIPGSPAAQFLQEVKRLLQEPLRLGIW